MYGILHYLVLPNYKESHSIEPNFILTTRATLISPVWNRVLKTWDTLFELIQIKVRCSKNYFNFFYSKKLELLEKHGKITTEATPAIEKNCLLNIYREYLFCQQSSASSSFLQTCINFVEQKLKFSHFEGSITITWFPTMLSICQLVGVFSFFHTRISSR